MYTSAGASVAVEKGFVPIEIVNNEFNQNWPTDMLELIQTEKVAEINDWYQNGGKAKLANLNNAIVSVDSVQFAPLIRRPRKIWGIGLNYRAHAADLAEKSPTAEPASFMKPDTAIIGYFRNGRTGTCKTARGEVNKIKNYDHCLFFDDNKQWIHEKEETGVNNKY